MLLHVSLAADIVQLVTNITQIYRYYIARAALHAVMQGIYSLLRHN